MPMDVTIIDSSVEALDFLYFHVISAHYGEMDIVPLPSSHLAGQWYNLRSAFQVRSSEQDIFIGSMLTAQARNGI